MPSPLLMILGLSSILLGLYITIVQVINPNTQADYHIGSYLSIESTSHSIDLRSRLLKAKLQDEYNRKLNSLIKTTQLVDNDLRSKSLALANSVNTYVQSLVTANNYQQSNMQFFTQLSKARQQYSSCANQLSQTINIEQNKQLWMSYKQCFVRYDKEKSSINTLYANRIQLLQQIDDLMRYDPNANRDFDLEEQLRKIKERYDKENANNDKNKQNLIAELKSLQHQSQTKSTKIDQNQRQYNRTKLQFEICKKNLKQFRKCQDIAKALREYGYVESFESLQERIRSKREILVKLREHALQNRQSGGDNNIITQMYAKREKELIQTIKLRLEMSFDEMKQCGCTEDQRKKLQKQFQDAEIKLNTSKQEMNELLYEIISYEKKIKQTDRLRQRLINEFREDTERLKNRETTNILTLQQKLAVLKQNLQTINQQLSSYSPKLNSIEFQCNQYKDRLGMKLEDGQKVSDCMAKKTFYDGLKDKATAILKQQDTGLKDGKDRIKILLQSVIYPEKLAIGSFDLSVQQEQVVTEERQQVEVKNQQHQEQQIPQTFIEVKTQQELIIQRPQGNQIVIEHSQHVEINRQPINQSINHEEM